MADFTDVKLLQGSLFHKWSEPTLQLPQLCHANQFSLGSNHLMLRKFLLCFAVPTRLHWRGEPWPCSVSHRERALPTAALRNGLASARRTRTSVDVELNGQSKYSSFSGSVRAENHVPTVCKTTLYVTFLAYKGIYKFLKPGQSTLKRFLSSYLIIKQPPEEPISLK